MRGRWVDVRIRRQSWFGFKRHIKNALSLPYIHAAMRTVATRVPGVEVARLPSPRRLREVRANVGGTSFVLLNPDRCEIAKELYWGRGRRPAPADAFALELMVALTREADVFLDIGAYTGMFSLAISAANPDVHTHAFEMVPPVVDALKRNVERNALSGQVRIHAAGVGDPDRTVHVPLYDTGSALPSFISSDMSFTDGVEVGFVALDELALDAEGPVVMKIDVEGGEEEIFAHGQRFLAAHRPDILCEVLPGADGTALEALLTAHGYHFYAVGPDILYPRTHLEPNRSYRDWLFTCDTASELRASGAPVAVPRER